MSSNNYKYPRTFHLPFSPGGTNDDKKIKSVDNFINEDVVITSKLDGSNLCLTNKEVFARTHSGPPKHASFNLAKSFHNQIRFKIPDNLFIYCEYLFAKHSIQYNHLPSYFMVFNILDVSTNMWLSWNDVILESNKLNMMTVPLLFNGKFTSEKIFQEEIIKLCGEKEFNADDREGIVIRTSKSFNNDCFSKNVAKWVKANHVQTSEHWKDQIIIKNKLNN